METLNERPVGSGGSGVRIAHCGAYTPHYDPDKDPERQAQDRKRMQAVQERGRSRTTNWLSPSWGGAARGGAREFSAIFVVVSLLLLPLTRMR